MDIVETKICKLCGEVQGASDRLNEQSDTFVNMAGKYLAEIERLREELSLLQSAETVSLMEIERLRALTTWHRIDDPDNPQPKDGAEIDLWVMDVTEYPFGDLPKSFRITDCAFVNGSWVHGGSLVESGGNIITHWMLPPAPPEDRT